MMRLSLLQRSATVVAALLLAGCATEYRGFEKPERVTGGGGEKSSFHGLDLWTAGLPQGEFEVIGEISDNRPCGALAMCVRGSRIASLAKEKGGDALILGYDGVGIKGKGITSGLSITEAPTDLLKTPGKRELSKYYVIRYLPPPQQALMNRSDQASKRLFSGKSIGSLSSDPASIGSHVSSSSFSGTE